MSKIHKFILTCSAVFLISSCTQQTPVPTEKTPSQKFNDHLDLFFQEWENNNDRFRGKLVDMNVTFSENNQSNDSLTAKIVFPFNWTEYLYQEESDFAQGYDTILQVGSKISIIYDYHDGNWSYVYATQSDFNSTLVDVADDYSKTIADAWVRRLPGERNFAEKEKLFHKIPPKQYQLP